MDHTTLTSRDGTRLAVRRWTGSGDVRAEVVLCHGLAEHMGRYTHVAERLVREGYAVTGFELRGHGHSAGKRGFVRRWSDYTDDLWAVVAEVGKPCFIVAHSMGGLVATDALRAPPCEVLGLVLSDPLLGVLVKAPPVKVFAGRLLSRILPGLPLGNELDTKLLTHDAEIVRAYDEDPLVFKTITPRWFTEMTAAIERVHGHAPSYRLPMLMLVGEQDKICSPEANYRFSEAYGGADKKLVRYPGLYHEIFNELQREQVFLDLIAWLNAHPA